jgi:integrase
VKELYSRIPAADFGPLALKATRQAMIDADHSRKYINKNIERIRRMFKWAAAEELLPASVPQSLSMLAGLRQGRTTARELPPVLPVDDAVVQATLPYLPEIVADMVRLQRLTGARPAEICMLRPRDLDRSGEVWFYRPESHKTEHFGKTRTILIGPKGQGILLRYLARDADACCFQPIDSEQKRRTERHDARQTPLSCGNRPGSNRKAIPLRKVGSMYSTASYRRAINRACSRAGVAPWAPNRLRHTTATEVRREFGLEAAQIMLGHSKADVTQVYAERDLSKGLEVAKRIG